MCKRDIFYETITLHLVCTRSDTLANGKCSLTEIIQNRLECVAVSSSNSLQLTLGKQLSLEGEGRK